MSDNQKSILEQFKAIGMGYEEAKIYLELLRGPNTHLRLSVITGINRTKVYRLIDNLEKRSLVARRTDDRGTFLVATDPAKLELELVMQEEKIKLQRTILKHLIPTLAFLQSAENLKFAVRTYEGVEGLKQMCWHELKTRGELLCFGGQTLEDLISNHQWAEKHRALSVEADYSIRDIINHDIYLPTFTTNQEFMNRYECRRMPSSKIYFNEETVVYNDTVAIYHWREGQKVGVEIISQSYANMMRQMFEYYWKLAAPQNQKRNV